MLLTPHLPLQPLLQYHLLAHFDPQLKRFKQIMLIMLNLIMQIPE